MVLRVNGGIVSDQMLSGSLSHFKIIAGTDFGYVVSDGSITIPPSSKGGPTGSTVQYFHLVGEGEAVPESTAELILRAIAERCTIVQIGLVGTPECTEIHIAVENTSIGWIDEDGEIDVAAMTAAIVALGTVTVNTTNGGPAGDNTVTPVTENIDLTSTTVTEVSYVLA
jgi:hypothetical protein